MLPIINYIRNTSWKRFQKHLRQYKELKLHCRALNQNLYKRQHYIICDKAEYSENNKPLTCIRNVTKDCFKFSDPDGVSIAFGVEYCPDFPSDYNVSKCTNKDCPYVKKNHAYCEVVENYKYYLAQKNNFWRDKFLQAR